VSLLACISVGARAKMAKAFDVEKAPGVKKTPVWKKLPTYF